MTFNNAIKTLIIGTFISIGAQTSQAQDLLARQAPVDHRMKAVDTLALRKMIDREQAEMPGMDLYADWNNKYAHKATELPDSFRINLKHFCMPTTSRILTSGFGPRWGRQHKGLDIKVYIGDTIRAAFSGKVRIVQYEAAGYGNYIVIRHNNGLETIYGHLSKHLVHEDQIVKAGDVIGLGGNTGRSTGSHLHFETRICGVALDPALLFDFVNQDVTCDSYMFRRADYEKAYRHHAKSKKVVEEDVQSNINGNAVAMTEDSNKGQKKADKTDKKSDNKEKSDKKKVTKGKRHTVSQGESLYTIAKKNGITVDELCKKNNINKNDVLSLGQKLKI